MTRWRCARELSVAAALWLVSSMALADQPNHAHYVDALVAQAVQARLHETRTWRRLMHYRPRLFGGYESEADGRDFFLAADGKTDPAAELEATIRGVFSPRDEKAKHRHPRCRFPARFLFLADALKIDGGKLARPNCSEFQKFMQLLDPGSLTLVFSSYYMNNPASAFGHTFLRVNKRRHASGRRPELLDYGIDYSAQVDTSNALLYALKGLFGLFPGNFRKVPYYFKVREYNDYESRDLWEYELELDRSKVLMVVAHLWELGATHFNYYYLSENCSYHVLGVIEAADPELRLLEHVGWPVIPADTIKAVYKNPGLVRSVHYRPSAETVFRQRVRDLKDDELALLSKLISNPDAPFPHDFTSRQQARVLDSGLDLVDSRYARELLKEGDEKDPEAAAIQQRLLERRAELLMVSEDLNIEGPMSQMPHVSHGSARFGLGTGYSRTQSHFHALRFRVALHDLADPIAGYPETSEIEFLPVELRYIVEDTKPWFEEGSLVRVLSLTPWDQYRTPLSFGLNVGAQRIRDAGCEGCLAGTLELAGGASVSAFGIGALGFLLGEIQIMGLGPIAGGLFDLPLRLGIGPTGGFRLRFTDDLLLVARGRLKYLPGQEPTWSWEARGSLRWQCLHGVALGAEILAQPDSLSATGFGYLYF